MSYSYYLSNLKVRALRMNVHRIGGLEVVLCKVLNEHISTAPLNHHKGRAESSEREQESGDKGLSSPLLTRG